MRVPALAAALVALTALPVAAQIGNPAGMTAATPQTEPGKPAPHQPNAQDRLFFHLASTGGMAEVEGARAAEKKATSPAVKDFARKMADEHSRANEQLTPLAKAASVPLPDRLDPDHQAQRAALDTLSGTAFDLAYMRQQLVEHQKTATLLEWEISYGQDGDLQRYAMQQLPGVLQHLEMTQAILAQLTGAAPQGLAAAGASGSAAPSDRQPARPGR
jgi:putative membrane protein